MQPRTAAWLVAAAALLSLVGAHGDQHPMGDEEEKDWATRHMKEEHHIDNFDANAFFVFHDFDNDGIWEASEIRRTYGLEDESNKHVSESRKQEVANQVIRMYDTDGDNLISSAEFLSGIQKGNRLPDFGHGPGHHGDDEYEYEIHHFELYHDENTREEDLTHPEDIEHFKKHDELEREAERLEALDHMRIVEQNIPNKFRKAR